MMKYAHCLKWESLLPYPQTAGAKWLSRRRLAAEISPFASCPTIATVMRVPVGGMASCGGTVLDGRFGVNTII